MLKYFVHGSLVIFTTASFASAPEIMNMPDAILEEQNLKTVHRPWGTYTILTEGEGFKVKRIEVNPKGRLSTQLHHHRSEHWVIASGTAKVLNGDREFELGVGGTTFIPATHKHRLENVGSAMLVLIETQIGDYLGEDDIVRFDDIYGRV